jgi:hypothetical protein
MKKKKDLIEIQIENLAKNVQRLSVHRWLRTKLKEKSITL